MIFSRAFNIRFRPGRTLSILILLFFSLPIFSQTGNAAQDTTVKLSEVSIDEPVQDSAEIAEEQYLDTSIDAVADDPEYFDLKNYSGTIEVSLQRKKIPDSVINAMQQDEDFWYANFDFEKEEKKIAERKIHWSEQVWFKTLMWLIIIGGFAFALISYLGGSNIGLFRRTVKGFAGEDQLAETENIFEINYKERIDRAVKDGNYQLAVRLHFLQILKTLSGKKMIQYKQDRTNFEYLLQMRGTAHYNDFFKLTRNYEYTWYGNFAVNAEMYSLIKNDFEKFDIGLLVK